MSDHDTRAGLPGPDRTRLTAGDFHPEILKLFDEYVHGLTDRRGFLERAARYAVAGTTAAMLLEALNPKFAEARQIEENDPRIKGERVELPSPKGNGKVRGYLVRPAKPNGKLPAVLVAHENRGLNPHIEDVTRRLAVEGFVAFAPDALFTLGGYPGNEDAARESFAKLDKEKTRQDFVAAAKFLKQRPETNHALGAVGFCWGGGIVTFLATRLPDLGAAVPFYGSPPDAGEEKRIKAPLLVHLAEHDDRINLAWAPAKQKLAQAGVRFEIFEYPGTQHGFNNDTTPRYDEKASKLAWQRTLDFFNRTLRKSAKPPTSEPKHVP